MFGDHPIAEKLMQIEDGGEHQDGQGEGVRDVIVDQLPPRSTAGRQRQVYADYTCACKVCM